MGESDVKAEEAVIVYSAKSDHEKVRLEKQEGVTQQEREMRSGKEKV